jgi:hypothetical protein
MPRRSTHLISENCKGIKKELANNNMRYCACSNHIQAHMQGGEFVGLV